MNNIIKFPRKIRLLYYGDAPCVATGFGTVARNILMPLYHTGMFEIAVQGINYWGEPHEFPFPIWPVGNNSERDPYGKRLVQERIMASDFDILMMVQDSFILDFARELLPKLRMANKKFRSVIYYPVDGIPKTEWVEAMSAADYPVTHTQFAVDESTKVYPPMKDKLRYIYHGANVQDFYPLPYRQVMDFKSRYFGPLANRFVFSNVNRNQQRKDIPRFLMAFKRFHDKHPESLAYCHMAAHDMGWKMEEVVRALGLVINQDVVFPHNFGPNRGFPIHVLNHIYNISDVVVSSTTGEGTGLAQLEAMATMTPVISPNNTACTEIIGKDRGLLVESGADMEHFTILPHDNEVPRPLINIQDMAEKMELLYNDEVLRMHLGENGYNWIHENLIWSEHISPQWLSVIDEAIGSLLEEEKDAECSFAGAMEV